MIDVDRTFRSQDPLDQHVRSGAEGSGVGTWDLDFSTRQLNWSNTTRKLFGVAPDTDVDYELFLSLLDPQDRDRTAKAVQQSIDTGYNFDAQYRVRRSDEGHWVRALGAVVNGPDGRLRGSAAADVQFCRQVSTSFEVLSITRSLCFKIRSVSRRMKSS